MVEKSKEEIKNSASVGIEKVFPKVPPQAPVRPIKPSNKEGVSAENSNDKNINSVLGAEAKRPLPPKPLPVKPNLNTNLDAIKTDKDKHDSVMEIDKNTKLVLDSNPLKQTQKLEKTSVRVTKTTKTKTIPKGKTKDFTQQISKTTTKDGVVSRVEKKVTKTTQKNGTTTKKIVTETVVSKPEENISKTKPEKTDINIDSTIANKESLPTSTDGINQSATILGKEDPTVNQEVVNKAKETDADNKVIELLKKKKTPEEEQEILSPQAQLEKEILELYNQTHNTDEILDKEEEIVLSLSRRDKIMLAVVFFIIVVGTIVVLVVPGIMPMV